MVSILTGPFGPVQPTRYVITSSVITSFNPHRPFRASATTAHNPPGPMHNAFQSSPALSGQCNVLFTVTYALQERVSILTGPFGPVQRLALLTLITRVGVSILTGPFGPVQHYIDHNRIV